MVSNVMTNRILPGWAYVPWGLGITAVLLTTAVRIDHRSADDLGIGRAGLRRGTIVGVLLLVATAAVYATALVVPATRDLFADERVGDIRWWAMVYQVTVRIPLGTVVPEEIAFRSVLLAMFLARTSVVRAVLASSVLFGLWHVLPAVGIEDTNPVLGDLFGGAVGSVLAVVAAVIGTTIAGVLLVIARLLGGHLVTPVLAHVATNSLGFLFAWWYLGSS